MARLSTTHVVDDEGLARLRTPRDNHLVQEAVAGDGRYIALHGPFTRYQRTLRERVEADGTTTAVEAIEFSLAAPLWKVLITPLARRALRRPPPPGRLPWWAPPDRFDPRAARVIAMLCTMSVLTGYLGTLISQTITFAADEFDRGTAAQGVTLAAVRVGVIIAVVMTALADRRGRRPILFAAAVAGCVMAATGAAATDLWGLGVSQSLARGLATSLALLIAIMAAEESPAGSRAYVVSVLAMTAALGSGMVVWLLPLADLGDRAWRLLYLAPLLALPGVVAIGRRLPESRRFEAVRAAGRRPKPRSERGRSEPSRWRNSRFVLLAATFFLIALFAAPASQFQNEFLRDERGFSAARITLFQLTVNTPAGIGVLVAGRLADTRGRRIVATVGILGGALATVLRYGADGWPMWMWGVVGTIVGAATVPALGVYAPELFATGRRSTNNGRVTVVAVVGSAIGLIVAGFLFDRLSFGSTFALLSIGPLLVAGLVLFRYPETARRELEDINPEDARAEPGGP